ncbi:MAG: ATP-binding protein [Planctomycetes bacterium]|nr:ATP-binding protein [Planctomycetota bacterium]
MQPRPFWTERIESAWRKRPIVWLRGVRRSGKTTLCRSLPSVEYFDCERPRHRRQMEDPEAFLESLEGRRVVLDEIHRLENPAELLKIAHDHFPNVRIIATGSSTLAATAKFKDTLAGRKEEVRLTPAIQVDLVSLRVRSLGKRLLQGGLPPFLLSDGFPEADYQEWLDSYWAKDIQELFRLERRHSFLKFAELVFASSGGLFEATRFAAPCEVSRTTIMSYLDVLEATSVVSVVRPYSTSKTAEIVSAPKVYAFDTGFVCHARGWDVLRDDDRGPLWEHYVLNELLGRLQLREVKYWRDKAGHEVDFVLAPRGRAPIAIECKWSAARFEPNGLNSFARRYPQAKCWLVANDVERPLTRRFGELEVTVAGLEHLVEQLG